MEAFYSEIRNVHIGTALVSGALLFLRALAFNFADARWPLAGPVRYTAWTIDTVLLTAALILMTIVKQYPGADAWLTVKVLVIVVYVILGYFALRGATRKVRVTAFSAAILAFGFIYTVARSHHPLGLLA